MMPMSRRFNRISPFKMWAEFVADDALQLVARKHLDAAARDADGSVHRSCDRRRTR